MSTNCGKIAIKLCEVITVLWLTAPPMAKPLDNTINQELDHGHAHVKINGILLRCTNRPT